MEVDIQKSNGSAVVSVKGRVDASTAPQFEAQLVGLIDKDENRLVVDLSGLEYISSAGLRVILATAKRLKAKQGDIILVGLTGSVKEVFEISGFYTIFNIKETIEAALEDN